MKHKPMALAAVIASTLQAKANSLDANNEEWFEKYKDRLWNIEQDLLPRGSGIDSGTTIKSARRNDKAIVLHTSFHHMNGNGFYDGWTEHDVVARPDWQGLDLRIRGVDRNKIKDYLHDVFYNCLTAEVVWSDKQDKYVWAYNPHDGTPYKEEGQMTTCEKCNGEFEGINLTKCRFCLMELCGECMQESNCESGDVGEHAEDTDATT